jgi:predicted signal transduction protein with EAL and GGDEF domain
MKSEERTANALSIRSTRLTPVTRNQLTDRIQGADAILKLLIQILLDRYRSGLTKVKGEHAANKDAISEEAVREYIYKGIDKIRLEVELKDALTDGQLKVFYQPLLNIRRRKIAGFEALTQWIHPERGFISPRLFITLADRPDFVEPMARALISCRSRKSS